MRVTEDFGKGGAGLSNPDGAGGVPDLAEFARDVADDLAALSAGSKTAAALAAATATGDADAPAAIASVAASDPPTKAEYDALLADVTALHGTLATAVAVINRLRADLVDVRAKYAALATGAGAVSLKTSKG